jgi:protein-S-isoprenylcysteine O-methyltransferase Ste14
MKTSAFEYRFRFAIHAVIYIVGFLAIPAALLISPNLKDIIGFTSKSSWLILSSTISRQGWLTFSAATVVLLILALIFTGLGAWLRVWGAAYVGESIVSSSTMQSDTLLADGPYRRTRNPLYLGTLLHTIGIAILMTPAGAIFSIALIWLFQVRLALAEEAFLTQRFGAPYTQYKTAVPRFLPTPTPQITAAGKQPHWLQALLGELYFVAAFGVLAALGWGFNAQPIQQGLLISLGAWLIARAFLPRTKPTQPLTA